MSGIGFASVMRRGMVVLALAGLMAASEPRALADSESWDAIFMGGNKVGWMRIAVEPVSENGRKLQRVRVDFNLEFRRGNDSSSLELQYGTIETPDGQVLRLDTKTFASSKVIRVHGDVIEGKMLLKIENGEQKQQLSIPWTPDTFGPYGPEMSLSRSPMKVGEARKLKMFVPELNKVVEVTLTAKGSETVALGGGTNRNLLRVEQETADLDGKKIPVMDSIFWADEHGQILKASTEANGGTVFYRTTKEAARRSAPKVDLIAAQMIKVARKINDSETKRDIIYKITMTNGDPAEFFPTDRRQGVIRSGSTTTTALLQVKTAGPDDGEPGSDLVGPEYLRSNPLITSTDPRVLALARQAVGNTTDPWAKAQAITKWVFRNMDRKNFESTFAPSDEVARTLSGDCTEHGVLTAAMCRAEGIPARVVTGLVYVPHQTAFGFHMWNEVYVNRRWVAIDSAYDETDVDATHLKLSESSLDGVAPYESFLPVARVFGKLRMETVEVR